MLDIYKKLFTNDPGTGCELDNDVNAERSKEERKNEKVKESRLRSRERAKNPSKYQHVLPRPVMDKSTSPKRK